MGISSSPEALASILRLQGLKNASRKVMEGENVLQDLNNVDTDVGGTSSPQNMPEPDLGGELQSQSYDVRANQAKPATSGLDGGILRSVGQALADYVNPAKRQEMAESNQAMFDRQRGISQPPPKSVAQTPPVATAQVDRQEGLPAVTASEQEAEPNALQRFGKWFKEGWTPSSPEKIKEVTSRMPPTDLLSVPPIIKNSLGLSGALLPDTFGDAEAQQKWNEYHENQAIRDQGLDPTLTREKKQQELESGVAQAADAPWQFSAYGAAEQVADHPALQEEFKEITGIDYGPEIANQVSTYEAAMKGVEESFQGIQTALTEQENQIKERILNNQSTDADMYYIGLALLMPLLIGGVFGKEAGLGALGGGAQGFADIIGRREKGIREDESSLLDIARQKAANEEKLGSMALEGSQLRSRLQKAVPEDPRAHLLGKREIEWKNPETGNTEAAVEILPGLIAKNSFVGTKEGLANRVKAAEELSDVKSYVDELNDLTNDVIVIASQLKDQNIIKQTFNALLSGKLPGSLSRTTEDVEFDGRKVNAGTLLEEKLGFLANAYAQAKELGQLDRAAQAHMAKIVNNPTASLSSPKDTINQMLEIRKLAQRGMVRNAQNKGFIPEFLQQEYDKKNNEVFSKLNKKEQDARLNKVLQETARSGTSYGK